MCYFVSWIWPGYDFENHDFLIYIIIPSLQRNMAGGRKHSYKLV